MQKDVQAFRRKLDAFSRKLERRTREFNDTGTFSDVQRAYWDHVISRHGRLHHRVAATAAHPRAWQRARDELGREYDAVLNEFARFMERLDADQMKTTREDMQ